MFSSSFNYITKNLDATSWPSLFTYRDRSKRVRTPVALSCSLSVDWLFGCLVGFYGISILADYSMLNPVTSHSTRFDTRSFYCRSYIQIKTHVRPSQNRLDPVGTPHFRDATGTMRWTQPCQAGIAWGDDPLLGPVS